MSKLEFWGWEKKPRTMLRFIKPGYLFCFKLQMKSMVLGGLYLRLALVTRQKYLMYSLKSRKCQMVCSQIHKWDHTQ